MEGGVTFKNTILLLACLALAWLILHKGLGWGNLTTVGVGVGVAALINCLPGVTYQSFWFGRTVLVAGIVGTGFWFLYSHPGLLRY